MSNTMNADLSPADMLVIRDALALARSKMPFLVALTPEERKEKVKMGDKSLAFVQDALMAAQNNPQILPASFSTAEFKRDVVLATQLSEINDLLQQLASAVDDTLLETGSEAMIVGLNLYTYVKAAAKTEPGLRPTESQLGERFKRTKKSAANPNP
ncbi:MAG TPA: hypothetical protein VF627_02765 [Abditibacterium sp.]|jgi:hypothetical protein